METKASYIVTGAFTLAVIAGVFGFVYWVQNGTGSGERSVLSRRVRRIGFRDCTPAPRCCSTACGSAR